MRLSLCGGVAHFRAAGLAKKCSEPLYGRSSRACEKVQRGSSCERIGLTLAKVARLILAKAGEFKAQLFGDITYRR